MAASTLWKPLSIPQAKFLAAKEFEVLYGGAKGGMKTESLVVGPLHQVGHERFKGLLLREHFDELQEIQDRCRRYYTPLGAVWLAKDTVWKFPSGARVWIGYCERKEHAEQYQGWELTYVGFDEIGNVKDEEIWDTLLAEIRCPDPALVPMARCSANPGGPGHAWVKRRFIVPTNYGAQVATREFDIPELGKTTLSVRFIPSRVTDNPIYRNDAQYMAQLYNLPETQRQQKLFGNWDVGEGMALDELNRGMHWVPKPEMIPDHWYIWGSFDWGFQHPWSFVTGAMNSRGEAIILDSIGGWRQRPDEIVERVHEHMTLLFPMHGPRRYAKLIAGRDCFDEQKAREARGYATPKIAEHFEKAGMVLWPANNARVFGLTNLRQYLAWRGLLNADGTQRKPLLTIASTLGNENLWQVLQSLVIDVRNREDSLKVNANGETGKGGDDAYDALRYLMADRPYVPKDPPSEKRDPSLIDPMAEIYEELASLPATNGLTGLTSQGLESRFGHGSFDQFGPNF
jgi:hypothetical protein